MCRFTCQFSFLMKENLLIEMEKCSFPLILLHVFILDIVLLYHPFFMFLVKLCLYNVGYIKSSRW